jgi:hypothetical protein
MAFSIIIQQNMSERNKVDKDINDVMAVSGTLKMETSVINPTIQIVCNLSDVKDCNYMTIPIFGRSYFITSIKSIRDELVEFTCHCDVLSSFASQIRNNSAIIKKQANDWNLYLNDGSFKVYQNPMVLTKAFPTGFTTQEFVLAVAGG